ncbi:MAG: NUDIX domain-containing protein [Candidatus Staskawiczbacteria bacterium]|nr:NUDIX domain-containing protein [Candidatus Staskawiczbacteria bacterium]
MPREKSAGAIIFRKDGDKTYYLLLHYPSGHWEFPKGHIEGKESEEDAARREVGEETGIKDIKILPGFKKYAKYFFKQYPTKALLGNLTGKSEPARHNVEALGGWIFKLVTFFVAETKTKAVEISHEHKGFLWLPIDEAIKRTTFKNSKKLLKEANDFVTNIK